MLVRNRMVNFKDMELSATSDFNYSVLNADNGLRMSFRVSIYQYEHQNIIIYYQSLTDVSDLNEPYLETSRFNASYLVFIC